MKNGNESKDVLGESRKRYRCPWERIGKYWPGKELPSEKKKLLNLCHFIFCSFFFFFTSSCTWILWIKDCCCCCIVRRSQKDFANWDTNYILWKVQSVHTSLLFYMNARQLLTWWTCIPPTKFYFTTLDFAPSLVISILSYILTALSKHWKKFHKELNATVSEFSLQFSHVLTFLMNQIHFSCLELNPIVSQFLVNNLHLSRISRTRTKSR